ncbi:hypothetical protein AX15_003604 [Amanita polypyramis BW_CC]|nr:hypothetical protein AX15_003604 [Amanita polypyramis BW_CC]
MEVDCHWRVYSAQLLALDVEPAVKLPVERMEVDPKLWAVPERLPEWNVTIYSALTARDTFDDVPASPKKGDDFPEWYVAPSGSPRPYTFPTLDIMAPWNAMGIPPTISARKAEKSRAQDASVEVVSIRKVPARATPVGPPRIDLDNLSSSSKVSVEDLVRRARAVRNSEAVDFFAPIVTTDENSDTMDELQINGNSTTDTSTDSSLPEIDFNEAETSFTSPGIVSLQISHQIPISSPVIGASDSDEFFFPSKAKTPDLVSGNRWLKVSHTLDRNVDNDSVLSEDASIDRSYLPIAYRLVDDGTSTEEFSSLSSDSSPAESDALVTSPPSKKFRYNDVETPEPPKILGKRKRDDVVESSGVSMPTPPPRKRQRQEGGTPGEGVVQTYSLPSRKRKRDEVSELSEASPPLKRKRLEEVERSAPATSLPTRKRQRDEEASESPVPTKRKRPNMVEPSVPIVPLPTRKRQRGDEASEHAASSTPLPSRKRQRGDESFEAFIPPVTSTPTAECLDSDSFEEFEAGDVSITQRDEGNSTLHEEIAESVSEYFEADVVSIDVKTIPVQVDVDASSVAEEAAVECDEDEGDVEETLAAPEEIGTGGVAEEEVADEANAEGDERHDEGDGEDDDEDDKEARWVHYLELCREVFGDGEESGEEDL